MINLFGKEKIKTAALEARVEMLGVMLEDKNTEIRRLKLELEKTKDFWMRETASMVQNGKVVEGAGLEFSDLVEPTEKETKNQVEKAQKQYQEWSYWNEGSGISYDPEGYLKEKQEGIN